MAGSLERKATDIARPINVLEDAGLLHRDAAVFRDNRPTYRIAEPLIGFYHAITRPVWDSGLMYPRPRLFGRAPICGSRGLRPASGSGRPPTRPTRGASR